MVVEGFSLRELRALYIDELHSYYAALLFVKGDTKGAEKQEGTYNEADNLRSQFKKLGLM